LDNGRKISWGFRTLGSVKSVIVDEMYGDWNLTTEQVQAELDRSLNPRRSDSLFDVVESLGFGRGSAVLDIGARDARHSITLHQRLGCEVVALDPVPHNVVAARKLVDELGYSEFVEVRLGRIEEVPADNEMFDFVFCRDVLSHVADLRIALEECSRVSAPGGRMVIYQTFATDLLEPAERTRLCTDLAVESASFDRVHFEAAVEGSPFGVESIDVVGSEWREAWEEDGTGRTSRQLLHAARLMRNRQELQSRLGEILYRVELSNALWGVYQMIGKLEPRIYVLSKP
jgi:2-polyprenyl-3-methyl-5-hydroxy-6-metoxy-1,4-benzoquinol methylase